MSKNINWVDSAELKAVKIDKKYGKHEADVSFILMISLISIVNYIVASYLLINYGDLVIAQIRYLLSKYNIFNILLLLMSVVSVFIFILTLVFSIIGIRKSKVGINHQVNTKTNLKMNIIYLSLTCLTMFIYVVLLIIKFLIIRLI